jgi:IS30 family transposase
MKYTHLTLEERIIIKTGFLLKQSTRKIAKQLGRSPSTVSREINRNKPSKHRVYGPLQAHQRALERRKKRGRIERLKTKEIREYVVKHLKKRWSPDQISGRIWIDIDQSISHESIYQFIYSQIRHDGYGYVKPGCEDLRCFLRRRKKRRTHKLGRRSQKMPHFKGKSIELRPEIVNERFRIGDWETDTVVSVSQKPGINTLVERKTKVLFVTKLSSKNSLDTKEAIVKRMSSIPKEYRKTLTSDNGSENSRWQEIEEATGMDCYLAHPYCSGERGTNENTNGLIRDYFPKKTDFTTISKEALDFVESELNNRPRKSLGYLTPLEMWKCYTYLLS